MANDVELLKAYAEKGSEEAFRMLVQQRLPLVFAAALRIANGDEAAAKDIAQTVFVTLARKASGLQTHPALLGWLFTTTHHVATRALRQRARRERREALMAPSLHEAQEESANWEQLRPLIDHSLMKLSESDRVAVLLRFFENRSFGEIAEVLRLNENAARMRVSRALDTLRTLLAKHGVTSTSAALGAAISIHGAPTLTPAVVAGVMQGAVVAGGGGGLLFFMSLSSLKLPIAAAVAVGAIGFGLFQNSQRVAALSETAELRAKIADLESKSAAPAPQPSPVTVNAKANPSQPTQATTSPEPRSSGADPATNPEARRLYLEKQMANVRLNVRSYFKELGLTEDQWGRYLGILQDAMEVELDAQALARANKLSQREMEATLGPELTKVRQELVAAIGGDANKKLIAYNWRVALRPGAEELASKLAFTSYPLTLEQSEEIVTVFSLNGGFTATRAPGGVLPEKVMAELEKVLRPEQYAVLRELQTVRRADLDMKKLQAN